MTAGASDKSGRDLREGTPAETREREQAWERGRSAASRKRPKVPELSCVSIVDNVREYAMFLLDRDGRITLWGESARLMKWWTAAEVTGAHLRIMYPNGGSEDGTAEEHLEVAIERGEYTGEGHRVRNDCSTFWARVTLTALKDPKGNLLGFAKVVRDFTAERTAEARANEAVALAAEEQARAEQASKARSLFVASVSHEIRSPLNALLGYLQLMEHEVAGPLPEVYRKQFARIQRISRHLLGVVEDVLDHSRLESGHFAVRRAPSRLGDSIEAALTMIEPLAAAKKLVLTNAVAGYGADMTYFGDDHRVRQILVNVLTNAIKFTPQGGLVKISAGSAETPSPDAALAGHGPWVYVRVEDTGEGIAPDRLSSIFEPFEQAELQETPPREGAGLGLSISRRLARLMGGDLTVRSQVGQGSAFFLWLAGGDAARSESPAIGD
jgi:PAS domain S-box-containing protein